MKSTKRLALCFGAAGLALLAAPAGPSTAATVATLDEMALAADVVVLGTEGRIHAVDAIRVVEVAPTKVFKGTANGTKLFYLAPAAGTYGVDPAFVGETALLFLKKVPLPPGYTKRVVEIIGEAPLWGLVLQTGRLPAVGEQDGDEILAVLKNVIVFPGTIPPARWSKSKAASPTTYYALKPTVAQIRKALRDAALGTASEKGGQGRRLSLRHAVAAGWACGPKCSVTREGGSEVVMTLGDGSAIRVTDKGSLTARMKDRESSEEESRIWEFAYRGSWYDDDATTAVISLAVDGDKCNETRSAAIGVGVKCGKTPPRMRLTCAVEQVPIVAKKPSEGAKEAGTPTEAWVCRPSIDMSSYPGTPLPWVFGAGGRLSTFMSGGLQPDTNYHIAP